jgi:site-specific recombinase XerD
MATKITKAKISRARPRSKPYEISGQHGLTLRVQPTGRKFFYCRFGRNGRMRLGDASVMTLARAEYLARDILNEVQDYDTPLKRDLRKATLGGFIESDYATWLRANRRRADRTLADLKRNFEKRIYHKRLVDVRRSDLDAFVAEKRAEGVTAATVVRSLNNLRTVMRLALDRSYIRENPFTRWKKPRVEDSNVTRYLDAEEERRLRNALVERDDKMRQERISANEWRRERDYDLLPEFSEKEYPDHMTPMVLVSLNTGLRYGELAALDWSAIDFKAKVLTVTGKTAKGAKTRHLPLNAEALDVLTRWKEQGGSKGLVFRNGDDAPIASVKTAWAKLLEDAKISDFRWHDLRHTFASKLVQRGVDLAVVRELLGHGDFALTLRYAHLEANQKADAVARLAA